MQSASGCAAPRLTDRQKTEIRAIVALVTGNRPRYSYDYIGALYGVTRVTVRRVARGTRSRTRRPWITKRGAF
jgi:hypothetical protein